MLSDPLIKRTFIITSAQVGKTKIIKKAVGYFINQGSCPILVVQPTLEIAESSPQVLHGLAKDFYEQGSYEFREGFIYCSFVATKKGNLICRY